MTGERTSNRWGAALAAAVTLTWATQAPAADCFAGLGPALKRGGYSPDMNCREIDQTTKYIGRTKPYRGRSYRVYLASYRTKTHGWGVAHGGDRILIFDSHGRYLGHYWLERGHRLRIVGSDVLLLNVPARFGNRLRLGRASPPNPAVLDGDQAEFAR